eukprot:TRINITY_DN8408_c0_g3_i2.p1 TRINITY_DN8408_c0_g3~~TRINITY_DN8408_c0_g3_i2.p1  ORF type:complete len:1710 (-),score=509.70 TRINITY_DN8408_c0_g3_i2:87-5057(-)
MMIFLSNKAVNNHFMMAIFQQKPLNKDWLFAEYERCCEATRDDLLVLLDLFTRDCKTENVLESVFLQVLNNGMKHNNHTLLQVLVHASLTVEAWSIDAEPAPPPPEIIEPSGVFPTSPRTSHLNPTFNFNQTSTLQSSSRALNTSVPFTAATIKQPNTSAFVSKLSSPSNHVNSTLNDGLSSPRSVRSVRAGGSYTTNSPRNANANVNMNLPENKCTAAICLDRLLSIPECGPNEFDLTEETLATLAENESNYETQEVLNRGRRKSVVLINGEEKEALSSSTIYHVISELNSPDGPGHYALALSHCNHPWLLPLIVSRICSLEYPFHTQRLTVDQIAHLNADNHWRLENNAFFGIPDYGLEVLHFCDHIGGHCLEGNDMSVLLQSVQQSGSAASELFKQLEEESAATVSGVYAFLAQAMPGRYAAARLCDVAAEETYEMALLKRFIQKKKMEHVIQERLEYVAWLNKKAAFQRKLKEIRRKHEEEMRAEQMKEQQIIQRKPGHLRYPKTGPKAQLLNANGELVIDYSSAFSDLLHDNVFNIRGIHPKRLDVLALNDRLTVEQMRTSTQMSDWYQFQCHSCLVTFPLMLPTFDDVPRHILMNPIIEFQSSKMKLELFTGSKMALLPQVYGTPSAFPIVPGATTNDNNNDFLQTTLEPWFVTLPLNAGQDGVFIAGDVDSGPGNLAFLEDIEDQGLDIYTESPELREAFDKNAGIMDSHLIFDEDDTCFASTNLEKCQLGDTWLKTFQTPAAEATEMVKIGKDWLDQTEETHDSWDQMLKQVARAEGEASVIKDKSVMPPQMFQIVVFPIGTDMNKLLDSLSSITTAVQLNPVGNALRQELPPMPETTEIEPTEITLTEMDDNSDDNDESDDEAVRADFETSDNEEVIDSIPQGVPPTVEEMEWIQGVAGKVLSEKGLIPSNADLVKTDDINTDDELTKTSITNTKTDTKVDELGHSEEQQELLSRSVAFLPKTGVPMTTIERLLKPFTPLTMNKISVIEHNEDDEESEVDESDISEYSYESDDEDNDGSEDIISKDGKRFDKFGNEIEMVTLEDGSVVRRRKKKRRRRQNDQSMYGPSGEPSMNPDSEYQQILRVGTPDQRKRMKNNGSENWDDDSPRARLLHLSGADGDGLDDDARLKLLEGGADNSPIRASVGRKRLNSNDKMYGSRRRGSLVKRRVPSKITCVSVLEDFGSGDVGMKPVGKSGDDHLSENITSSPFAPLIVSEQPSALEMPVGFTDQSIRVKYSRRASSQAKNDEDGEMTNDESSSIAQQRRPSIVTAYADINFPSSHGGSGTPSKNSPKGSSKISYFQPFSKSGTQISPKQYKTNGNGMRVRDSGLSMEQQSAFERSFRLLRMPIHQQRELLMKYHSPDRPIGIETGLKLWQHVARLIDEKFSCLEELTHMKSNFEEYAIRDDKVAQLRCQATAFAFENVAEKLDSKVWDACEEIMRSTGDVVSYKGYSVLPDFKLREMALQHYNQEENHNEEQDERNVDVGSSLTTLNGTSILSQSNGIYQNPNNPSVTLKAEMVKPKRPNSRSKSNSRVRPRSQPQPKQPRKPQQRQHQHGSFRRNKMQFKQRHASTTETRPTNESIISAISTRENEVVLQKSPRRKRQLLELEEGRGVEVTTNPVSERQKSELSRMEIAKKRFQMGPKLL